MTDQPAPHFNSPYQDNSNGPMTPVQVRDRIVEQFYIMQKDTLARVKTKLGMDASDEKVHGSVVQIIKLCFREVNDDFEQPSKAGLNGVAKRLSRRAAAWGTSRNIVEQHAQWMQTLIDRLR